MRQKTFVSCLISNDVYVSSSGHSFIEVHIQRAKPKKSKERYKKLCICNGTLEVETKDYWRDYTECPRYVLSMIMDELEQIKDDEWRFYEYDREGNRRYEDLRYADLPNFLYYLNAFKANFTKNWLKAK